MVSGKEKTLGHSFPPRSMIAASAGAFTHASVGISAGITDGRHAVKRVGGGLVVELGLLREGRPGVGIGAMVEEEPRL